MSRLGRCRGLCVAQAIWGLLRSLVVSPPGTFLANGRSVAVVCMQIPERARDTRRVACGRPWVLQSMELGLCVPNSYILVCGGGPRRRQVLLET